jgi:hypothetical protein
MPLVVYPVATAMASIVCEAETEIGAVYWADDVVGADPFVV